MVTDADLDTIKGWFFATDREVFAWLLEHQNGHGQHGDLVELGCYMGKSAVAMGEHLQPGEHFTVLDLFEGPAGDEANAREMSGSYASLTRAGFEANYLRFHDELPTIVMAPSSEITAQVQPDTVRFMHVDASHLYEHVRDDVFSSKALLTEHGVVVFDDYRSEHTPGVSCAVWEAVVADGMVPLWVSPGKLYAAWRPRPDLQQALEAWVGEQEDERVWFEYQTIAGHEVMRVKVLRSKPIAVVPVPEPEPAPPPPPAPEPTPPPAPAPVGRFSTPTWKRARALGKDLTPPLVARRLHRLRLRLERR